MHTAQVLTWEMHAAGTDIAFLAHRDETGFGVVITRDEAILFTDTAADGDELLRKSKDLRHALQRIGYGPTPVDDAAAQLAGGLCWGPAAPLTSTVLGALHESIHC